MQALLRHLQDGHNLPQDEYADVAADGAMMRSLRAFAQGTICRNQSAACLKGQCEHCGDSMEKLWRQVPLALANSDKLYKSILYRVENAPSNTGGREAWRRCVHC